MSEVQVIGCWAPLVYDYDPVSWLIKSQGLRIEEECPFIWGAEFSSVQFSCSVVSDSLRPHESQHTRPPGPSPTPGVHPDSRPLSQWYHLAISSSVVPFSSCPQSLPASESFPMSQLFTWGGHSTGWVRSRWLAAEPLWSMIMTQSHGGSNHKALDWRGMPFYLGSRISYA